MSEVAAPVAPVAAPVSNSTAPSEAADASAKTAAAVEAKKWALKANGKERVVTQEAELIKYAQLGLSANEKFEAAAAEKAQLAKYYQEAKGDPIKFMANAFPDIDLDAVAEQHLAKKLRSIMENEALTPEQKAFRAEKAAFDAEKAELAKEKQDKQTQAEQAAVQKLQSDYSSAAAAALKAAGLSDKPINMRRIAEFARAANSRGLELNWADFASDVKADLAENHKTVWSDLEGDALLNALGDLGPKIQQALIAKYKARQAQGKAPTPVSKYVAKASPEAPKYRNILQVKEALRSKGILPR